MSAELRFFHCGDGDTILIRGGDEWALVDANFTETKGKQARPGMQARVEEILDEYNVQNLRFVCVTHFDTDHIKGLGKFLRKHFRTESSGGRVHWNIGQIILPLDYWDLRELLLCSVELYETYVDTAASSSEPQSRALRELMETLRDIAQAHRPGQPWPFVSCVPREPLHTDEEDTAKLFGPWEILFLGPRRQTVGTYWRDFGQKWGLHSYHKSQWPRHLRAGVESNSISRIMALTHTHTGETVLLTGDATELEIANALAIFKELRGPATFTLVKASHHGACPDDPADNCHHRPLYDNHCVRAQSSVVIPCRGSFGDHPHRTVLSDILSAGLNCRLTGADMVDSDIVFFGEAAPASEDVHVIMGNNQPHQLLGGRCGILYLAAMM